MIVKSLGHASLFIRIGSLKIMMDPWLSDEILGVCRRFPDPGPLDFKIPHPDIIILSHHHWDHVHIPTLYAFNKTTPIYIPENEQLQMILDILGFTDIRVVRPWDQISLSSNTEFIVTPSKVPFGEMGVCFLEQDSYLLNLVDSVFDSQILGHLRDMLTKVQQDPFGVCLCPYQSYDEMSALMRQMSVSRGVLSRQNAEALVKLECDLIIPFADGLYYPGNKLMNHLAFLNHPYDFIDDIKAVNPEQVCMIGLVLDEWYIENNQFKFSRSIPVDTVEILSLYDELRSIKNTSWEAIQSNNDDKLHFDVCKQEWSIFIEQFCLDKIPSEILSKLQSLAMKWHLIVLGDLNQQEIFIEIDFDQMLIEFDSVRTQCNAYLKIGSDLLLKLLRSEELLSIAMQSDRIELWGCNRELAYRSLDVLWYMGLDDKSRLEQYVTLQSNSEISVKIAENWV